MSSMVFWNIQEEKLNAGSYLEQFKAEKEASNCEICWNYVSEEMKQHRSRTSIANTVTYFTQISFLQNKRSYTRVTWPHLAAVGPSGGRFMSMSLCAYLYVFYNAKVNHLSQFLN